MKKESSTDDFDLDKTGCLLKSLPPLFPSSSSFLWLALHSSPLNDSSFNLSKKKFDKWKSSLAATFTLPTLKHNLRNSHEVASVRGIYASYTSKVLPTAPYSEVLPAAPAPRPLPTLPPTPACLPIILPLHPTSQLAEAVKHAYVMSLQSPATLVVLLDDINKLDVVKTSLAQLHLSVVTYTEKSESASCKTFLENPAGVLITTPTLFSGMEATNVIWVRSPYTASSERSSRLRAIEKLCIIDTRSNYKSRWTVATGLKADDTFAKCNKDWLGILDWWKSCYLLPILLWRQVAVFRRFLHFILQYNPCSCKSPGGCQLKHPTRSLLSRAVSIIIANAIASVFGLVLGIVIAIGFGIGIAVVFGIAIAIGIGTVFGIAIAIGIGIVRGIGIVIVGPIGS